MTSKHFYKTRIRPKGQITLPEPVRSALSAREGDDLLFLIGEDGRVSIQLAQTIAPEQAWFWEDRWQKMEREAQADIDAGHTARFTSVDDAIAAFERGMHARD